MTTQPFTLAVRVHRYDVIAVHSYGKSVLLHGHTCCYRRQSALQPGPAVGVANGHALTSASVIVRMFSRRGLMSELNDAFIHSFVAVTCVQNTAYKLHQLCCF